MSDVRTPGLVIKLSPGEKGLVAKLRETLDGRALAPIVRAAVLQSARDLTTTEEPADA